MKTMSELYKALQTNTDALIERGFYTIEEADKFINNLKEKYEGKINIYLYNVNDNCNVITDKLDFTKKADLDKLKDSDLLFRGSSNQRLIDVQKSLKENKVVLWRDNMALAA